MSHAAEGLLQAYLDGEVEGSAAAGLEAHLSACDVCAAELQQLRAHGAVLSGALAMLDRPVPEGAARKVYWHARSESRKPKQLFTAGALVRAAGILLVLSGGVMAVVPGSPLRRVLSSLGDGDPVPAVEPSPPPVAAPAPAAPVEGELPGVTIVPNDGRMQVRLWSVRSPAEIRVNLVDGPRVSVQAGGEAGEPRFRSGAGRIEVMNVGGSRVAIEIPRSLPFASIEVDGRQWLFKDGDQLRPSGPVVEQSKDVVVFRAN